MRAVWLGKCVADVWTWQYNALSFALTRRVVNVLWPREGATSVEVHWADANPETLHLTDVQVVYTWHRVQNCVGSPTDITVGDVHSEYVPTSVSLPTFMLHCCCCCRCRRCCCCCC